MSKDFSATTPKARSIKVRINKLDPITIHSFYASNDTFKKTEKQVKDWKKICPKHISDK